MLYNRHVMCRYYCDAIIQMKLEAMKATELFNYRESFLADSNSVRVVAVYMYWMGSSFFIAWDEEYIEPLKYQK